MKLRYFQPQRSWVDTTVASGAIKVKWYDDGPAILQYYTERDGFWQDVELVRESEQGQYDGEHTR